MKKHSGLFWVVVVGLFFLCLATHSQHRNLRYHYLQEIDSLDQRIVYLQAQLPELQRTRSLAYFQLRSDLEHTLFIKLYTTHLYNEDLDQSRDLVELNLQEAELKRDDRSIRFYNEYKKQVFEDIKRHKMRYQNLFSHKKNFRKEIAPYLKTNTLESLDQAARITELAIKYANENQFTETAKYLRQYQNNIEARIIDFKSPFNLQQLGGSQKRFDSEFNSMAKSDSLVDIEAAQQLLMTLIHYCRYGDCAVDPAYLERKMNYVANSIADYHEREGTMNDPDYIHTQVIVVRLDTLNRTGVYKWHNKILVINELVPNYTTDNLKRGQAIIEADRLLFRFLDQQELLDKKKNRKVMGTRMVPFINGGEIVDFWYNFMTKKWQYMVTYESIDNMNFTQEITKYMFPVLFSGEGGDN